MSYTGINKYMQHIVDEKNAFVVATIIFCGPVAGTTKIHFLYQQCAAYIFVDKTMQEYKYNINMFFIHSQEYLCY